MEKVYPKELKENPKSESSNCIRRGIKMAKEIEKKYGKKYLSIEDNMEWGLLCGRLETLRWIMGSDWGNLDT